MQGDFVRQGVRFGLTGVFTTALHVLVAVVLIEVVEFSAPLANGAAFVIATGVSYLINSVWSFSSALALKRLTRFLGVSLVGLALSVGIAALADRAGLSYWFGLACVVGVVPPVTFLLHRLWTYRQV